MSDCKHRGEREWTNGKWLCVDCKTRICTDCGSTPAHRDGDGYCRRCGEKNGNRRSFVTTIDHDLLRAKVGDELAEAILTECWDPWT